MRRTPDEEWKDRVEERRTENECLPGRKCSSLSQKEKKKCETGVRMESRGKKSTEGEQRGMGGGGRVDSFGYVGKRTG